MAIGKVNGHASPAALMPSLPALRARVDLTAAPSVAPARLSGSGSVAGIAERFREAKLDYDAAKTSRFRRTRTALHGTAAAHLQPYQADRIREYARDMARNDAIVSAIAWRAVDNVVRTGLHLVPQTGDSGLDRELKAMHDDWGGDPRRCDVRGMHTFPQMERLANYAEIVDGDIFGIFDPEGRVQLVEGEWCASPKSGTGGDVYNGVEIDDAGRPVAYHFVEVPKATRFAHVMPVVGFERRRVPARDRLGYANVVHVLSPDRVTQYRGVTAFHAVFDRLGMLEDIEFARLVQQQVVSMLAVFITTDANLTLGKQTEQTSAAGGTETVENLEAGTITRLRAGETPHGFSPKVPNPEYFTHVRQQIRTIAAAIGLPLEIVFFDTTDTTFHGYRGAMQQAYIGFQCRQRSFPARFHRPIYERNVARWLPLLGRAGATAFRQGRIFRHDWVGAGFPYVDPFKDAQADELRERTLQVSPRRRAQERGYRFEDIVAESIDDRADAIEAAATRAADLSAKLGESVSWRELLGDRFAEPIAPPADPEVETPDEDESGDEPSRGVRDVQASASLLAAIPRTGR